MNKLSKFIPHGLALLGFIFVSLLYFYPVLQHKQLFQSDIAQYIGMAKEQNDFRKETNQEPYWTNTAFGGMPTYQLGAQYPNDFVGHLDDLIRFLPRPADYLFLYFFAFYCLLLVLKIDPLKAFIGAIVFGLSTYLIIILGVGHNAKAHAIGYMPLVVAGFMLVFRQKYFYGGLLTTLAVALELNANHFQMTYYLLLFLVILSTYKVYYLIKRNEIKPLLNSLVVLAIAGLIAIGLNATNLLATAEYAEFSTRGKSELTINSDGSKKENDHALTKDYITEYSYGKAESLNLIAPRLFGGSNSEALGEESSMYQFMVQQGVPADQTIGFVNQLPTYWGNQPIVAAPAYIGIVVFFLAVLGLFTDKRKIKYIFLSGALMSLILSWGKNIGFLTNFLIDYLPLYNKFRAVSSIQVILEMCMPVLAIMGLQSFFDSENKDKFKDVLRTFAVCFGLLFFLFIIKGFFNYSGVNDTYYSDNYGPGFVNALVSDRKTMYMADLVRSGFFVILIFFILFLYSKNKQKPRVSIIIIGLLAFLDLFFIDKNYVNETDFVSKMDVEMPFKQTNVDAEIAKDTTQYRVFEVDGNFSSARASYFHHSLGGYHAAKPRRIQQLFDYQISKGNLEIFNMLNVKYVIQTDKEGNEFPAINPDANGNAWFVSELKSVETADQEMKALDNLSSKITGIIKEIPKELKTKYVVDSLKSSIKLTAYKPNDLKYKTNNPNAGFAVFSEIYYKNGWKAYIDNIETPIYCVDYVLRGIEIPAGKHQVEFKFEPQVIKTGSVITIVSFVILLLLILSYLFLNYKKGFLTTKK